MSLQAKLQSASEAFQKLQNDLSTAVEARQRLDAQLSENELVKKEFAQLTPNNVVFKLIGPVLVKQEQTEAKNNVETRLEFIRGEIKRVETQLKEIEAKQEKKKLEVSQCHDGICHSYASMDSLWISNPHYSNKPSPPPPPLGPPQYDFLRTLLVK